MATASAAITLASKEYSPSLLAPRKTATVVGTASAATATAGRAWACAEMAPARRSIVVSRNIMLAFGLNGIVSFWSVILMLPVGNDGVL